jgi:hypothetical protein
MAGTGFQISTPWQIALKFRHFTVAIDYFLCGNPWYDFFSSGNPWSEYSGMP